MGLGVYGAERGVVRGLDSGRVGHLRGPQRGCREVRGSAVDGLAVHEGIAIGHGDGVDVVRVHEIDIANVGVEDIRVADERVAHVDLRDELTTAVEPREEGFAKAQRKPTDPPAKTKAGTKTKAASQQTDKSPSA